MLSVDIIQNISEYATQFCSANNINYINSITTNGFLLTDETIQILKKYNFTSFQITIDGNKEKHNQTRRTNDKESFDNILNNITKILDCFDDVQLTLRYNYTEHNLDLNIVDDVNNCIPHQYRQRIEILMRKVWQIDDNLIDLNRVEAIRLAFVDSGYIINTAIDIGPFLSCPVEAKHYNSVFHNGSVDKCSNRPLEEVRGYLNDNGEIILKTSDLNVFSESSSCRHCKYLPICMGPCPLHREASGFKCKYQDKNKENGQIIIDFCKNFI